MAKDNICKEIEIKIQEHILRIMINRPEKKNALTRSMYAAMADAITLADGDSGIRAVFIQGTEDCFTAGNDLKDFQAFRHDGNNKDVSNFLVAISQMQKPQVAAAGLRASNQGAAQKTPFRAYCQDHG